MVERQEPANGFALAVLVEGSLALLAVVLAWIFQVPLAELVRPREMPVISHVGRGVLVTLPLLGVFFFLARSSQPSLRELRRHVETLLQQMLPAATLGQLALIAVLAGVGEELLFRGVAQTLLVRWTNPLVGLLLGSLLFGLAHAVSKLYFTLALLIGLCFGWLTMSYNDLIAPIVAHSLYDFVALVYLSRQAAKTRTAASRAETHPDSSREP
jgi:uncharacterized protein